MADEVCSRGAFSYCLHFQRPRYPGVISLDGWKDPQWLHILWQPEIDKQHNHRYTAVILMYPSAFLKKMPSHRPLLYPLHRNLRLRTTSRHLYPSSPSPLHEFQSHKYRHTHRTISPVPSSYLASTTCTFPMRVPLPRSTYSVFRKHWRAFFVQAEMEGMWDLCMLCPRVGFGVGGVGKMLGGREDGQGGWKRGWRTR